MEIFACVCEKERHLKDKTSSLNGIKGNKYDMTGSFPIKISPPPPLLRREELKGYF